MMVQVILPCMGEQPHSFAAVVDGIMLHVIHQIADQDAAKDWHRASLHTEEHVDDDDEGIKVCSGPGKDPSD